MPVVGTGTFTHGGSGQAAAAAESPLGLFEALLQMAVSEPLAGSQFVPAPKSEEQQAELGALLGGDVAATPELAVSEPAPKSDDATFDLLADLLETLAALEQSAANGMPVDPGLEHKAAETLDALATVLGLPILEAPAITPASTAAAGGEVDAASNALATIEAAAAVVAASSAVVAASSAVVAAPAAVVAAPAAVVAAPAASDNAILPVASDNALVPAASQTASTGIVVGAAVATEGVEPAAAATTPVIQASVENTDAPAPELPPLVKELADKLTRLAAAVEPRAPILAEKLTALAEKLGSGNIDAASLAKLGLGLEIDPDLPDSEIEAAIARLLTPAAETKPLPAPAPFTAATLALPDPIVMAPRAKPAAPENAKPVAPENAKPAATTAPAAQATPDAAPEDAGKPDLRVSEGTEKPSDPASQRTSFAAAMQAGTAPADNTAPQTQPASPAVPATTAVAADTKAIHAAYSAPVRQINMPQVAFEIVRQVQAGASRFQIRLDPPELGRVDVKLDVDAAGNINARMTVERAETLDLMQRDQRSLEKALALAGLDSSKTNLEFSLRENPFGRDSQRQQGGNGQPNFPRFGIAEAEDAVPAPHITAYRGYASATGVNLFV